MLLSIRSPPILFIHHSHIKKGENMKFFKRRLTPSEMEPKEDYNKTSATSTVSTSEENDDNKNNKKGIKEFFKKFFD